MKYILIVFIAVVLTACGTDHSKYKVFNDISYIKGRMIAALLDRGNYKLLNLEELKKDIRKDDSIVEDLRDRGLISQLQSYSTLVDFYSSQKLASDNDTHWVDYSRQTLIDNTYSVPVSESVCDFLNKGKLNKNKLCIEGIYSFNLVEQTKMAYEFKVIRRIPDSLSKE